MASANIEKAASAKTLGESIENPVSQKSNDQELKSNQEADTPTFRQTDKLPQLLHKGIEVFKTDEERKIFLLSTLTACSGLFTNMYGVYRQNKVFPNLFLLVEAPPASGKSVMLYARKLIKGIHNQITNKSLEEKDEYDRKVRSLKKAENDQSLPRPIFKTVLIPANCSGSKFISHLADNQHDNTPAILFESEIDTLTIAIGNDWGNFSDVLRKAFHNEPVSMSRRKDNEYIEVNSPKLAVVLSGTMNQVKKLINNSEDGLYSRFLVYKLDGGAEWSDVSPCEGCNNLTDFFEKQTYDYLALSKYVSKKPIEITLTRQQWATLNKVFGDHHLEANISGDPNITGLIRRHGLMVFKICMVLTAFRIYENKNEACTVECWDEDFETAMQLVELSLEASKELFQQFPGGGSKQIDAKSSPLYRQLPEEFTHADAIGLTEVLGMAERTIERHLKILIKEGLLIQPERGKYRKVSV